MTRISSIALVLFLGACAEVNDNDVVAAESGVTTSEGETLASPPAIEAWAAGQLTTFGWSSFSSSSALDADGDGYTVEGGDCNDADPREAPDPTNVDWANDGLDQDCSGSEATAALPNTQFLVEGSWSHVVVRCGERTIMVPLDDNGYGLLYGADPDSCGEFILNVAVRTAAMGFVVNDDPAELGDSPDLYAWVLPGEWTELGYGIAEPLAPTGSFWDGDPVPWLNGWPYGYPDP